MSAPLAGAAANGISNAKCVANLFLFGETRMATATVEQPRRSTVTSAPLAPLPPPAAEAKPAMKGLATDWAAMVIWAACFGLMALIHLKDLFASLFR
jgi:hypothetical protein